MKTVKTAGRNIVRRWFDEVFSKGSHEAIDDLLTPTCVFHGQGHQKGLFGRDEIKKWLDWYRETFQDNEWDVHDIIQEGNKIAVRYSSQSKYQGGLLNVKGNGQKVKETGILIFLMNNRKKIKDIWCELSDLQLLQQIGGLPKEE